MAVVVTCPIRTCNESASVLTSINCMLSVAYGHGRGICLSPVGIFELNSNGVCAANLSVAAASEGLQNVMCIHSQSVSTDVPSMPTYYTQRLSHTVVRYVNICSFIASPLWADYDHCSIHS